MSYNFPYNLNSFKTDVHGNLYHSSQKNQHDLKQYVVHQLNDTEYSIDLSKIKFESQLAADGIFTGNLAAGTVSFSANTVHVRLTEVDVPDLYSWPAEVRPVIVRQRAQAGFLLLPVWSGFFVPDQNQAADVAALAVGENPGSGHWYSLLNGVTGVEGAALLERLIAELNRDPESYLKLMPHTCDYGSFLRNLQAMTDAVAGYAGLALWWEVK